MKDRAVLLSTLTLVTAVALFVWLTLARWGTVGIHPALGGLVLGSALLALAAVGFLLILRRRSLRARQRRKPVAPPASPRIETAPAAALSEEAEDTKVAAVEMK